jgi:riboflavin synthase
LFTGIIECLGVVESVKSKGTNKSFVIRSDVSTELHVDQSVSHNGVCLTVESISGAMHTVTAVEETLRKSNLSNWEKGDLINIERCVKPNSRMDGHFVQGHVDDQGLCTDVEDKNGSWIFTFKYDTSYANLLVSKGSIAVNGVSLTVIDPDLDHFKIAIIPYTYKNTSFRNLKSGDLVNLEFDIIGKYFVRSAEVHLAKIK